MVRVAQGILRNWYQRASRQVDFDANICRSCTHLVRPDNRTRDLEHCDTGTVKKIITFFNEWVVVTQTLPTQLLEKIIPRMATCKWLLCRLGLPICWLAHYTIKKIVKRLSSLILSDKLHQSVDKQALKEKALSRKVNCLSNQSRSLYKISIYKITAK